MVSYRRLAMRVLGHVPVLFGKKKASPPPRVAAQRIAALALACAMMTGMALPAFAGTYDIANGSIEIHAKDDGNFISQWIMNEGKKEYYGNFDENYKDPDSEITITGKSTGNSVTIDADKDQTANVTLDHVEINASSTAQAAVEVTGSGDTNIELNGNNTLTGGNQYAGLQHNKETDAEGKETSGKLTITDTDGNGSLCATGNYGGAGIGGGNMKDAGKIEITGGSITAATGGLDGAGIGGGGSGGDADITISGGTINAIGGTDPWERPGAIGGAGIGSGGSGGDATVTITGGAVIENATGGGGCAGIGGSYASKSDVTISGNATIETVTGGKQSAGIGGGSRGRTGSTVTIKDNATIKKAQGGDGGAGIGGGVYGSTKVFIEGSPTIESTTGGNNGAGIGGGAGSLGDVIIDGNATITNAKGGNGGAGIGGGAGGDGNVTITGNAEIQSAQGGSYGAGIGGGAIAFDGTDFIGGKGTVTIDGNTTDGNTIINHAQGGEKGAGIGGGYGGLGAVTITGNAEIQSATGGIGAAGIGGGAESEPDDDGTGKKTGNEISIKSTEAGSPNITAKGGAASDDGLSGGAAIGSGSVYENDPQYPEEKASAAITIEGKVTIAATAGGKLADKDAIAIGDTPLKEQKFAGLPVGAVIKRKDSDGKDLTQEGDKPTEPEKPEKPDPEKPNPNPENPNPNPENPNPNPENPNPNPENPNPNPENPNPNPENPNPNPENPNPNPENPNPNPENPNPNPENPNPNPENPNPNPENPNPNPENPNPNPEQPNPNPEQPSEPSGAVSTSAPAEELTASDAEYLVTVEGLYVTNALGKQITHTCTQNVQGKVLTIRVNSIVATAHLTMETLRTLKAQGVETIRFCTLLYRPTSVSIDALLNLGVDEADILWTHNGIQARLTVGGTDSSSLLQ